MLAYMLTAAGRQVDRALRRGVAPGAFGLGLALVALALWAASASAAAGDISTVAGTGTAGFSGEGGAATAAQLSFPVAVTAAPGGGYAIADQVNNRVRKVAPDGTITTIAGSGTAGFDGDGGPATSAKLNAPSGLGFLPDGSLLIADANNNRVRKVAPGGTISTVAGTGAAGFGGDGGPATSAQVNFPYDIAVRADGSYLIADTDNNRVRVVSAGGVIDTYGGTGGAGALSKPFGVALAADGSVLIADTFNHRVRRATSGGAIATVAGTGAAGFLGDGGPAIEARLNLPTRVAVMPGGGYLIADRANHRLRRVSPSDVISTVAGNGTGGFGGDGAPATAAQLNQPVGVAVTSDDDFLIADTFNHRIRSVDAGDPAPPPPPPPPPPGAGTWYPVGTGASPIKNDTNADAKGPSLADLGGSPRIAWAESAGSAGYQIRASRYDGTMFDPKPWRQLLNPPNPSNNNAADPINQAADGPPTLAMVPAPDDPSRREPWVAWKESSGAPGDVGIRVSRYGGSSWQRVGPALSTGLQALGGPSIAAIGGSAYVAWAENDGTNYEIRVKRFDGTTWQEVGTAGSINVSSTRDATNPDLADIGGVPHVAWTESDGTNTEIRVKRFDGSAWQEVGSGASPINVSPSQSGFAPSLDGVGGVPHVAWYESDGSFSQIRVSKFTAGAWSQVVAGSLNSDPTQNATSPSLASIRGVPHVAWREPGGPTFNAQIRVSRLTAAGTAWQSLTTSSAGLNRDPGKDAYDPEVASIGGVPVVAWAEDEGGSREIFVSAFGEPSTNSSRPTFTGTPRPGNQLNCSPGTWTGSPTFTYLWDRAPRSTTADDDPGWTPIPEAGTQGGPPSAYVVQAADAGSRVRCRVVATGADFSAREAVSASKRVDNGPPVNTRPPRTTGTPITGQTLTCDPGEWTNGPDFTYRWFRDGAQIAGESGRTYRTADGTGIDLATGRIPFDGDNEIGCEVTASNDVGGSGALRANSLHVVFATPRNITPPKMVVQPPQANPVGRGATCSPGAWERDYGQYTYSWYRNGGLIAGETGQTYTTKVDDLGKNLQCGVVSTNPVGPSSIAGSNEVLIRLPIGTEDAAMLKAGARNEFDPVNLMALSKQYKAVVEAINVERFTSAVEADEKRCQSEPGVPAEAPKLTVKDFFATQKRAQNGVIDVPAKVGRDRRSRRGATDAYKNFCALLLRNRQAVAIGPQGVIYTAAVVSDPRPRGRIKDEPCSRAGTPLTEALLELEDQGIPIRCPDLGYFFPPVDPNNPGTLSFDQQARLDPVTPVRVLWDYNWDGKLDADCSADSPVVRTMLDKKQWIVRAVIVTRASAATGVYPSGRIVFNHFSRSTVLPGQGLREAQPFACRTSLEPPPDPEQGPCLTKGTIGRVQVQGDLCPVYIRALDPAAIAGLPPEVYAVLKEMAKNVALHRPSGPERVPVPLTPTSSLRAFSAASAGDRETAAAYANTASSYASIDDPDLDPLQNLPAGKVPDVQAAVKATTDKAKKVFDPEKANFSLDQIYWGQGPVKVNGVALLPEDNAPTLLVPTEAGKAIQEVNSAGKQVEAVKAMTINTPEAQVALGCAKKPTLEGCALPLAKQKPVKAVLDEAKSKAEAVLTKELDLKNTADSLKKKAAELTKPFTLTDAKADVKLENDGTATLTAETEVPLLKDTKGNGFTVKMTLKGDLDGKVTLQGIKVGPINAKLGGVNLSGVVVEYNQGNLNLQGQILFPPNGEGIRIEQFGIDRNGELTAFSLNYVAGAGSGIPIGPGVYINEIGGGFTQIGPPFILNTTVGVSAGPSAGGGCSVAGVRSKLLLALGGPSPKPDVVADVVADVMVMCFKLGQLKFHADSSPYVSVDGQAGINEGPLSIKGKFFAAIDPKRGWQGGGEADLTLKKLPIVGDVGPLGGKFVISNKGAAACVEIRTPPPLPDFAGGIAERFPGGVPPLTTVQLIANFRAFLGCDLSEYKPLGRRIVASDAQAGASTFTLPRDASNAVLSIEGAGGAPRVRLRSPAGKVYDFANATGPVKIDNAMAQIVAKEGRTVVILGRAQTGTWTVESLAGSPSVVRVQLSKILPKPKASGKVAGVGYSRTLRYRIAPLEGQEVRFVEDAPGGYKVLKTVKRGGRGSLRFMPGEARGSKRTITAQVSQDGFPRENVKVASYRAANPPVGRPGKVKIKRKGSRAVVRWKKASLASRYEVVATGSDGRRSIFFVYKGAKRLTIPGVARDSRLSVRVVAFSPSGRKGSAGRAKLKSPKKKKPSRKR